jgi:hypothetical protein
MYHQQAAVPGGLRDTSPHSIVARANGEATLGAVKFGMGVVQGSVPGTNTKLPVSGSTADMFEGVVMTSVKQMDLQGVSALGETDTLGVLKWGRAWVRVKGGLTIAYGEQAYLVNDGDDAGLFTNDENGAFAVNGKFIGGVESGDIAPVELYNQSPAVSATLEANETTLEDHESRISTLEA